MGHNLARGDLALPFASGENWTISQGFDNKLTTVIIRKEVINDEEVIIREEVPVYFDGGHEGIDWSCCSGTPIHAMASGRVSRLVSGETAGGFNVPDSKAYGNQVRIRTGTGTTGFELTYAHLADVYVCLGQEVVQGQLLGLSGYTGRGTARHLHVHLKPFGEIAPTPDNPHGMSKETFLEGEKQPVPRAEKEKGIEGIQHKNSLRMILGTVDFSTFLPEIVPSVLPELCPQATTNVAVALKKAPQANAAASGVETVAIVENETSKERLKKTYDVIGKDTSPNPQWWQIVVPNGAVGWVPNDSRTTVTHPDRVWVTNPPAGQVGDQEPQASDPGIDLRIKGSRVNVRRTPDVPDPKAENNVLGQLTDRNWRVVSHWACNHKDMHIWFRITVEPGELSNPVNSIPVTGWVRRDVADLQFRPPEVSAGTTQQVREWPSLEASRIANLVVYQRYAIIGKSATTPVWYQIRFSPSLTGWVHGGDVHIHGYRNDIPVTWPPQARIATEADVSAHSGPSATHEVVKSLSRHAAGRREILGRYTASPTWWLVSLDDESRGWVHEDDVQIVGDISGVPVMWPPQLSLKVTTTDGLNVRSGPGTGHNIVASIAGGSTDRYGILGKDAATAVWYRIQFSETVSGWVHADYVHIHGDLSHLPVVGTVPTGIRNLTIAVNGSTSLHIDWQTPTGTGDATHYDVQYRVQGATAWISHTHIGTVTAAILSGLTPGSAYQVQVRATNAAGFGPWASVQASTDAARPQLSLLATTTDGLNVRSGPSTGHVIVASIAGGSTTRYDILGKDAATATWYQIRFSPTLTGWVHSGYTQTDGDLTELTVTWNPPQLSLLATTTDGLNVRSGPDRDHNIVASIAGGSTTRYAILGKDAATATWYQIRFSNAVTGWVSASYIQTHGDLSGLIVTWNPTSQLSLKATTTLNLNVRSGPGSSRSIVGSITGGSTTRYNILGKDAATATWYQIQFSSTVIGWVSASYIQTHGDLSRVTVTWNPPQLSLKATTTDGLNVRSTPSTGNARVGFIQGGTTARYAILGKDAATATWYQIQFSNTVIGWVHANYIQTHGDLSGLNVTWNPPQLSLKATTTANLNVRSGPGTSHSIVGSITGGSTTRYNILGKDAATATWYQIQFSNTVTGWVSASYIQTHGNLSGVTVTWNPIPQLSLKATTTANLNVRSGPGASHSIVGSITGGSTTRYNILGKDAATATWYQIRFSSTVTGWVSASYIQTHGNLSGVTVTWNPIPQLSLKATTTANLNVRSGPGTTHGIVGSITVGSTTRYNILGKNAATATWYQIRFSDTVAGWVYVNLVQTHGDLSGVTVTWNPTPQLSLKATTTANLNIRSGPGTTHGIVGSITGGSTTRYNILGKNAATATWYQIRFSSGATGWVYANLVQTHGNLSGVTVTWNPTPQLSLKATTTANLNVRSGPGTTFGIAGSIVGSSTARYNILGKNAATATWYQIQFSSSVTGWVSASYIQTHGNLSGVTVTWAPPQLSLKVTTTANLNVRSRPGTTHSIVGSIAGGSTIRYNILGKNAATATWWQIRFSDTVIGWVYANLVQTHGDVSGVPIR